MKDTDATPPPAASQLQQALLTVQDLHRRLEASDRAHNEPIAIIGASCRFPDGVEDLEGYWRLLRTGADGITEVPPERWQVDAWDDPDHDAPGQMATRWGGFLTQIDQFDAAFFGLAPQEAASMDPQHRLLLEGAWQALEHAGQAPDRLLGTPVGVFVGISSNDYASLLTTPGHTAIDAQARLGNAASMAAGRLSYTLGLTGPSLIVDTACSSSLVAVHLAVHSLRRGECPLALAAGVNLILCPAASVNFSKAGLLAADGRCKTFDAAADGYGRGEGCGVVVLKRLTEAVTAGDRILAVIRGSAVHQDGSGRGLTAPNGTAQEAVIRQALSNAGIEPGVVGYVEAHGTGTPLGDLIEVGVLQRVFASNRGTPFYIGSVKTNFGHLEAAAGIAGLLKVVLALQHGELPPHLHFHTLHPQIAVDGFPLHIPTRRQTWEPVAGQRIAGVSAFGLNGTNAHVVVEAAPATQARRATWERSTHLLCLSARNAEALSALATQYRTYFAQPHAALAEACYSANTGRSHFRHRLAVVAHDADEMQAGLAALAEGRAVAAHPETDAAPAVAFLFTGQGAQYVGMGKSLYDTQPRFHEVLQQCDALLRGHLERPLLSVLFDADSPLHDTLYTQPALFALEVALAELWRSWGIEPRAVLGHSVGEYAAAYLAGVFDLATGLGLVAARGRLMQSLPRGGAMVVVFAAAEEVRRVIAAIDPGLVVIAAENGPHNTVISGDTMAVRQVLMQLRWEGIAWQSFHVSHAFHSPLLEPILNAFERRAGEATYRQASMPVVSNLTGRPQWSFDAAYWRQQARQPVRFAQGVASLAELGCEVFLEVGPHPVLTSLGRACQAGGWWLPSLRRGGQDWRMLLESLGRLYVLGAAVDWTAVDRPYARHKVVTPGYPFQRQRHWVERPVQAVPALTADPGHPLLGRRLRSALRETMFEQHLDTRTHPFLEDHVVGNEVVLPGATYLALALAAAPEVLQTQTCELADVVFAQALAIPPGGRTVQCIFRPEEGQSTFEIFSLHGEEEWTLHASGRVRPGDPSLPAAIPLAPIRHRCRLDAGSPEAWYAALNEHGVRLGPAFQGLTRLWRGDGEALAEIHLPAALTAEAAACQLHPALLEACFQTLGTTLARQGGRASLLPVRLDRLRFYRQPETELWCHVVVHAADDPQPEAEYGDLALYDQDGQPVACVEGLHLRCAGQEGRQRAERRSPDERLYAVDWQPKPLADTAFLPSGQEIAAAVVPQVTQIRAHLALERFRDLGPQLEVMATEYVILSLRALGWDCPPGKLFDVDSLAAQMGVVPRHRRLLARLCTMLQEDGILASEGPDTWVVLQRFPSCDAEMRKRALLARFPECHPEIELLGRCGRGLAETLRGVAEPLPWLLPPETPGHIDQDSPCARLLPALGGAVFTEILARFPDGQPLRILEVGAGTGSTTATVLPLLPADRTRYVCTDVASALLWQDPGEIGRVSLPGIPHPRPGTRPRAAGICGARLRCGPRRPWRTHHGRLTPYAQAHKAAAGSGRAPRAPRRRQAEALG